MSKSDRLIKIASASLALGTLSSQSISAPAPKTDQTAECYGINTQKGTNSCGIGQPQIDAANHAFKNRFAKSKPMECAGNSDCSAKKGFLAWMTKDSNDDCFKAGGFVIEKGADGKLVVRDKNGVKKS